MPTGGSSYFCCCPTTYLSVPESTGISSSADTVLTALVLKIISDQLCSLAVSVAVVEENVCVWAWERSLNTVRFSLWGVWEVMGEVCLEPCSPTPWAYKSEVACWVGCPAPGLECGLLINLLLFSKAYCRVFTRPLQRHYEQLYIMQLPEGKKVVLGSWW